MSLKYHALCQNESFLIGLYRFQRVLFVFLFIERRILSYYHGEVCDNDVVVPSCFRTNSYREIHSLSEAFKWTSHITMLGGFKPVTTLNCFDEFQHCIDWHQGAWSLVWWFFPYLKRYVAILSSRFIQILGKPYADDNVKYCIKNNQKKPHYETAPTSCHFWCRSLTVTSAIMVSSFLNETTQGSANK